MSLIYVIIALQPTQCCFILLVMRASGQPPLHAKKGIKVMQTQQQAQQPSQQLKISEYKQSQHLISEVGSVRSSRSRGISMSRESGINLDRIYDAKHFLPPKPTEKRAPSRSREGETRTLISCKSLEFIRLQESETSKASQLDNFQDLQIHSQGKKNGGTTKVQTQTHINHPGIEKPVETAKYKINKSEVQAHLHPNIISF